MGLHTPATASFFVNHYGDAIPVSLHDEVKRLLIGQRVTASQYNGELVLARFRDIQDLVAMSKRHGPKLARFITSMILMG